MTLVEIDAFPWGDDAVVRIDGVAHHCPLPVARLLMESRCRMQAAEATLEYHGLDADELAGLRSGSGPGDQPTDTIQ
jgi:hypothetical protein